MALQLKNATILITGGTGSFGHTVLQRLIGEGCKEVRVFSRDENKQFELSFKYADKPVKFFVGDIRDKHSIGQAMSGVDYVFHAAALKHVPTGEFFPAQIVQTNIIGSSHVMESAIENNVKNVVCLSTDKAVMPVNAMGMSKALMEKHLAALVRSQANRNTTLCLVRYGNVMCSRGSVIPLFISQILEGKPITLTHEGMTRFMLPLQDAVDLVLHALEYASAGDLFIKKSPACTIKQLALVLMKMFNKKVEIKTIGMRLGEKINETLASPSEMARAQDYGAFLRIPLEAESRSDAALPLHNNHTASEFNSHLTKILSDQELEDLLLTIPYVTDAIRNHHDGELQGVA